MRTPEARKLREAYHELADALYCLPMPPAHPDPGLAIEMRIRGEKTPEHVAVETAMHRLHVAIHTVTSHV